MTSEAGESSPAFRLRAVPGVAAELRTALADGERALHADGDLRASRQSFETAYELAELSGDVQAMALAVLGLAGLWVSEQRTVTGTVMLEARLQQVLSLLDGRSVTALRIRARLAGEADYRRGESAAILAVLDEARAAADPVLLAETLSLAHHCTLGPDDVALRRELADELVKVSFRSKRRSDQLMGLMWQTVGAYSRGDWHADRFLAELRDQLSKREHLAVRYVVSAIEVMLAIRAGQLDDAESLAGSCAGAGRAAGDVDNEWWPAAQLATIRWYQGRLPELLPLLRDRVGSPSLSAVDNSALMALALAAAQSGDERTAASCLAALRNGNLATMPKSSSWLATMIGIVQAAHLIDDISLAGEAYQLILPYAQLPAVGGLGVTCFGSVQQGLGVACLTTGDLDLAIKHLSAAVEHNLALGHWPAVLSSRQNLAAACERRNYAGDLQTARRSLTTAARERAALKIPGHAGRRPRTGGDSAAQCERLGRKWRVTWRDQSAVVGDSVGMLHLAVLIANPRQEIPAADLVAGLAALAGAADEIGTGQPLLDQAALDGYRQRVNLLDDELSGLDPCADADQVSRVQAERDWLLAQLASATGLAGRTRAFPDEGERARIAAGKAIRRAIARLAADNLAIGEHLHQTVRTGNRCSYWPA